MLLSLPTSAKQLPKPRPARAGWHSHENQGRAAPACAAQPLELAAEPCRAERSRARGAQRERSAEQEHSPASPGPARPDRDLARLKPSPSLRPSENLLLPAGLFPAIYRAGLTRCPCEQPSPGKQLPQACSPNRGALRVLLPCPTVHTQTRPTPALVAEACALQVPLLGMLLQFSVLLPAPHHSQLSCTDVALVALLSKGFPGSWPRSISHPEHLHGVRQAHGDRPRALSSDPSCGAGRLDVSRAERLPPRESRARCLGEAGD